MLKLEHVQKRYPGFALDCSLEVKPGYITGLIGENGAGKSTTFKAVLGLIAIDGGRITLFGKELAGITPADKEALGVVLSDSGFSRYLTVGDCVPILGALYRNFDKDFFLTQAKAFGLPLEKRFKDFSTGMQAKMKVLTAASHGARLLILDEPTAGLDVLARDELLELLRAFMEQEEGRSILISSHISGDLESLCDDLYMIHQGKVVFHEDTDVLLSDYGLIKADATQFQALDKRYILRRRQESYGWCALTNQKQFYRENYPALVVENGSIDEVIMMMAKGEQV